MKELICEKDISVPYTLKFDDICNHLHTALPECEILRFISSRFDNKAFQANILYINRKLNLPNIFKYQQRRFEDESSFNVCFLIPTGIGCEIGGHAGDGTPALKLIASGCDQVITHPNVVNASDINELPENVLYVEGSHITQLLMGTVGLMKTRKNKILALIDESKKYFRDQTVNSVNAARATLGIDAEIEFLESKKIVMEAFFEKKKAVGRIKGIDYLTDLLNKKSEFDAVAISSPIQLHPSDVGEKYSQSNDNGNIPVNPWGGVESMLTHFVSGILNKPSAHAPMLQNESKLSFDYGIVDSRIAPEVISTTFFHCVLKGLHKAPKIVSNQEGLEGLFAKNISALIVPDGVLGLPVMAALHQGIKVIAVKNKNIMENDLSLLPWKENQFFQCESYIEASGILNCLREGINISSIKRPLKTLCKNTKNKEQSKIKTPYRDNQYNSHLLN